MKMLLGGRMMIPWNGEAQTKYATVLWKNQEGKEVAIVVEVNRWDQAIHVLYRLPLHRTWPGYFLLREDDGHVYDDTETLFEDISDDPEQAEACRLRAVLELKVH